MFKRWLRLFFNALLLVFFAWSAWNNQLIIYGCEQGYGQLKIVRNARPVSEVLQEPLADSTKQKFLLILEIKKFAFDSLGINFSKNYSDFFDQHGKPILLTFSASEPYSLKAKEWTFPFLGTVSYKGYFNLEKARSEIIKLKGENYDVDVYSPSGWSTLGWFRDPILSGMLKRSEGELSNLIIHELTHGTLYVKNNVTFNENLASFIGDKGAEKFLICKFGKSSKEYSDYEQNKHDEDIYNNYILSSAKKLETLYESFGDADERIKKTAKQNLIKEIVLGVNHLKLYNKKLYFHYSLQAFREGNAFFLSFVRYDSEYDSFDKEYREKYHSDLKEYLNAMKGKYPSL